MLVLLGLPAILPEMLHAGGRGSSIGLVLLTASWTFFAVFLSLYGLLVLPWLAEQASWLVAPGATLPFSFVLTFVLGLVSWISGAVLVAAPFVRRRANPAWIGYLILSSSVAVVVGNLVIAPNGPVSNLALNFLSNLGPVLFLAAVGYLGFRLWSDTPKRRSGVSQETTDSWR
jgi:hypothetical protein